jgi:16S rRNA (uracil1498-N3)-methyltransferase
MHFFLDPSFDKNQCLLNEEESRHASRVLRLKEGDEITIGDGKGACYTAAIRSISKGKVRVDIVNEKTIDPPTHPLRIAIAPTKNLNRFEWFLEKATEMGVDEIIPLQTSRTLRPRIKQERAERIVLTATKQSQRAYLPIIAPLTPYFEFIADQSNSGYIAHCEEDLTRVGVSELRNTRPSLILIGPEGDFSKEEIAEAEKNGFMGLELTHHRLRTETAGIFALAALQLSHS